MQNNYHNTLPAKTSYGYSGQGAKKNDKVKLVMAGAAGLGLGAAVGVGSYMAYSAMTKPNYEATGTAYDQSWCQRPGGVGSVMQCTECYKIYGSKCTSENSCFGAAGCDFGVKTDMERDDVMMVGFIPEMFTPPLTITIIRIDGMDYSESDICPANESASGTKTFDEAFAKVESVNVDLFVTLTQVESLDPEPAGAPTPTLPPAGSSSSGSSGSGSTGGSGTSGKGMADGAFGSSPSAWPLLGLLVLMFWLHRRI